MNIPFVELTPLHSWLNEANPFVVLISGSMDKHAVVSSVFISLATDSIESPRQKRLFRLF